MTGIKNKAGKFGCNKCGAEDHWIRSCPQALAEERAAGRPDLPEPQLVEAGEQETGGRGQEPEPDNDNGWEEGVAMVLPAEGFIAPPLDPSKLYLDSCASHSQLYLELFLKHVYETQAGLHTVLNGGASTANEHGLILGAIEA